MKITTDRLLITRFTIEDTPFVFELLNTPAWIQNIGDRGVRTLEDARSYIIEKYFPSYEKDGFGAYKVMLKDSGVTIGMTGFFSREGLGGIDARFAFLPDYEGFGYAYESTRAVLDYELERHGFEKILAITLPENQRSINLLERLGFVYDKIIRLPNDDVDLALYVLKISPSG